jgi:hypothetical protein
VSAFEHLKKMLEDKGTLTPEEVTTAEAEHGAMSDEEKFWLESEKHKKETVSRQTVTVDEYLKASEVLDTAGEGGVEC